MNEAMHKKRSFGVSVFATIFLMFAILQTYNLFGKGQTLKAVLIQLGVILIALLTSFGLYNLKKWGRWLALYFGTASYLIPLLALLLIKLPPAIEEGLSFVDWIILLLLTIWAIAPVVVLSWFFTRPKVKEQFK
jgi:hypothetical protein